MRWPCRAAVTFLFLVAVTAQRGSRRFSASSTDNDLPENESTSSRSHRFNSRESSRDVTRTKAVPRQDFPSRDAEVLPTSSTGRGSPTRSFRSRNDVSSRDLQSRNEVPIVSSGAVEYERLQNVAKPSRRTFTARGQSSSDSGSPKNHLNEVDRTAAPVNYSGRSNRFSSRGSTVESSPSPNRRAPSTVQSPSERAEPQRSSSRSGSRTSSRSSSQTERPVINDARPTAFRSRTAETSRRNKDATVVPTAGDSRPLETTLPPERPHLPETTQTPERSSYPRNRAGGRSLNVEKPETSSELPLTRGRGRTSSRTSDVSGRSTLRSRDSSQNKEAAQDVARGSSRTSGRPSSRTVGEDGPLTRSRTSDRFRSRAQKTEIPSEPPVTISAREPPVTVQPSAVTPENLEPLVEIEATKGDVQGSFASPEPATPVPTREVRTTSSPLARSASRANRGRGTAKASTADALLKAKKAAREAQQNLKLTQPTPLAPDEPSLESKESVESPNPTVPSPSVSRSNRNFRKNLGRRGSKRDDEVADSVRAAESLEISSGPKNGVRTGGPFRASPVFRPRSSSVGTDLNDNAESAKELDSGAERSRFVPTRARLPGRGFVRSTRTPAEVPESTTEVVKDDLMPTRKYENVAKFRGKSLEKPYESGIAKRRNFQRANNDPITTESSKGSSEDPATERTTNVPYKRGYKRTRVDESTERPTETESPTIERNARYPDKSFLVTRDSVESTLPQREPLKEGKSRYSLIGRQRSFQSGLSRPSLRSVVKPANHDDAPYDETVPDEDNSANELVREETEGKNVAVIDDNRRELSNNRYNLEEKLGLKSRVRPFQSQSGTELSYVPRNRAGDTEKFRARTEGNNDEPTDSTPIKPRYHLYDRQNDGKKKLTASIEVTTPQDKYKNKYKSYLSNKDRPSFTLPKKAITRTTPMPPSLSRYKDRRENLSRRFVPEVRRTNPDTVLEDDKDDSEVDDPLRRGFNGLSVDSLVSESEFSTITTEPHNSVAKKKPRTKYSESHVYRIPPRRKPGSTESSTTMTTPFVFPTTEFLASLALLTAETSTSGRELENFMIEDELKSDFSTEATTETESTTSLLTTVTVPPTTTTSTTTTTPKPTTRKASQKTTAKPKPKPKNTPRTTKKPKSTTKATTTTTTTTTPMPTTTTALPTTDITEEITTTEEVTEPTTTTTTTTTTTPKPTTKKPAPKTTAKPKSKPKPKNTPRTTKKPKPTTKATTTTTTTTTTTPMPTTTTTLATTVVTEETEVTEEVTVPPTTTSKPTTTTTSMRPTTKKPAPKTTKKPKPKTTRKPKATTKKPPTTTVSTTPSPATTAETTVSSTPTPTTTVQMTVTPVLPSTQKILTNPPVVVTYSSGPSSTTAPSPTSPITESTTTSPTTTIQPVTISPMETPRVVTILSTLAQLANNLTAPTSTTPQYGNTAKLLTYTQETSTTPVPPPQNSTNYVVYGLLPNNNLVRKVVRTTQAPVDVPFIIYGLYPNGTIVRRYPNGTVVPELEEEGDNEVIANIEPGNKMVLEEVVKKDSPLAYLYPQSVLSSTEPSTVTTVRTTHIQKINAATTPMTETPTTSPTTTTDRVVEITTRKPTTKVTTVPTTKKPTTVKQTTKKPTTKKPGTTRMTTKKPKKNSGTTRKPVASTTKKTNKPTTTKTTVPTTTVRNVVNATTTVKSGVSDVATTASPVSNVTSALMNVTATFDAVNVTSVPAAATNATTSTTTPLPAKIVSTTAKSTTKSQMKPTSKPKATSRPKSKKKTTTRPTTTTVRTTMATTSATTTTTTTTTTPTPTPSTKVMIVTPVATMPMSSTTVSSTSSTTKASTPKPKSKPKPKPKTTRKPKPKATSTTKSSISSLSDVELLNNVLKSEKAVDVQAPVTESEESLANKVIQLAIEKATQKGNTTSSTAPMSSLPSTVPVSNNATTESLMVVTPDHLVPSNKTGKISLWVINDDNSTTIPSKSSTVDVDNPDVEVINALLSTPGIDQLSIREQLILADVLSSTAFPPTTKKKKRPKTTTTTTTTTPRPSFPLLRALFGRSREPATQGSGWLATLFSPFRNWAQGRGLFGGGLTGGFNSFRDQNQNFGGLGAESIPSPSSSPRPAAFGDDSDANFGETGPGEAAVPQEAQRGLVGAAINVSRAVSQFMGFVIQGATQSFQNYLQTRTRALADVLNAGPIS